MSTTREREQAERTLTEQRLFDLVRHQRHALFEADLIDRDEYSELLTEGVGPHGSVFRLEGYDRVRERLDVALREIADLKAKLAEAAKDPLYKAFCEMEVQRDFAWRLLWRLRRADVSSQWGCWCSTDNGPHTPECIDASSIFINLSDKEREQL